jgi:hypothetical protein
VKRGGKFPLILKHFYDNSLVLALERLHPEQTWLPWKFPRTNNNFWPKMENQRRFFDWLGTELKLKSLDDWHDVHHDRVSENGGKTLLLAYGSSLMKALQTVYPEHPWQISRRPSLPHNFWKKQENQKLALEQFAKKNGFSTLDDWYKVKVETFASQGGGSLLTLYNSSLIDLLKKVYPDHDWVMWKFGTVKHNFWKDDKNQRDFFDWL